MIGKWQRKFDDFIAQPQFNANQIGFLRAVQNVFLKKRLFEVADLYEEPLNRFGEDAVKRWFTQKQVDDLIKFTAQFAAQYILDSSLVDFVVKTDSGEKYVIAPSFVKRTITKILC